MAHKKGQGSTRNGRDSPGQRRGIKIYAGQTVKAGNIIIRQLGTRVHPGRNVGLGSDYTIFSKIDVARSLSTPLFTAPAMKRSRSFCITAIDFLPIAARRISACSSV